MVCRHSNKTVYWFAGHSKHIGFYPKASGIESFKQELSSFTVSKGTVQFPFNKPLPIGLITKNVKFRVAENMKKGK